MIDADFLFYLSPEEIDGDNAVVSGQEFQHLIKVLRRREGDRISCTDGEGTLIDAEITTITKREAFLTVHHREEGWDARIQDQLPNMAVGLIKKRQRLETMAEKLVEIGIRELYLVDTKNSERNRVNTDRVEAIMISAMKQSKRTVLPKLHLCSNLSELLDRIPFGDTIFLAHERTSDEERKSIQQSNSKNWGIIGPEGGFQEKEIDLIKKASNKVEMTWLGEARLRTETAAMVLCCKLNFG